MLTRFSTSFEVVDRDMKEDFLVSAGIPVALRKYSIQQQRHRASLERLARSAGAGECDVKESGGNGINRCHMCLS